MLQSITDNVCYMLPVSDDGGSTSEIVKIVGGPGIGDIRSRLVRLAETKTVESKAVYDLLSYRLPVDLPIVPNAPSQAKIEWSSIVEGTHTLWTNISVPYRETIRAFFLQFHYEILKLAGHGTPFDFRGGSLGNFFLTGCRLFFDSLDAAIFQFARITRAPSRTDVMSVIDTGRNTVAIGASLRNGMQIIGQCEISHPGTTSNLGHQEFPSNLEFVPSTTGTPIVTRKMPHASGAISLLKQQFLAKRSDVGMSRSAVGSQVNLAVSSSNLIFSKAPDATPPLQSPIRRVYYVNSEHKETFPTMNSLAPAHLTEKKTILYAMGSLYTSIIPCLIVPGMGRLLSDDYVLQRTASEVSLSPTSTKNMPIPKGMHVSVGTNTSYQPPKKILSVLQETAFAIDFDEQSGGSRTNGNPSTRWAEIDNNGSTDFPQSSPVLASDNSNDRVKILLLNGTRDRETADYTALDFILAITDALNYSCLAEDSGGQAAVTKVTKRDVIQDMDGAVQMSGLSLGDDGRPSNATYLDDTESVSSYTPHSDMGASSIGEMESSDGRTYLVKPYPPAAYITHMLYPENGEIDVEVSQIEALGIKCIKVHTSPSSDAARGHYEVNDLRRALEPLRTVVCISSHVSIEDLHVGVQKKVSKQPLRIMFKPPPADANLTFAPAAELARRESTLEIEGVFRDDEDNEYDTDQEEDDSVETLVKKLSTNLPHRGPQSKTKPRKKGVDFENDLEFLNRKLLNVDLVHPSHNTDLSAVYQANDPHAVKHLLPTHATELVLALNHEVPEYNLNAIKQLRRYMCLDEVPDKTERVLELNLLPRIREILETGSHPIQYEACWVLTNIAAGPSEHTKVVVDGYMIAPLIKLLESSSDQVRVQAAWALGNIAGDCKEYTEKLLKEGIIRPLLLIPANTTFSYRKDTQALHVVCWVIANLCRWDNKNWEQIIPAFDLLVNTVLHCKDDDVLSEAIWALSRIFHGRHPAISALITTKLCSRFVNLLQSPKVAIQNPVLRVMTNISGDSDSRHTQVLIDSGILFAIQQILALRRNYPAQVIVEVLHCLSNITAGTTHQKEAVSSAGLFEPVRDILAHGDFKAKKEACHVLRNAVDRDATPEHFKHVVGDHGQIFEPVTNFILETHSEPEIQLQAIETLNIIFSRGDEPLIRALYPFAVSGVNVYVSCMNYVSERNFERVYEAYRRAIGDGEDLAPLLFQCVLKEAAEKEQLKVDSSSPTKTSFASANYVNEHRVRKRIAEDLKLMVNGYLKEQTQKKQELENLLDGVTNSVVNLGM
ncbi:hypothetical protein HDV05_001963 [Chytridiales sp. JEL 0842]|nr:hypothetical protein HDV05_001963 [Chytridiales sp. JEL 0842]